MTEALPADVAHVLDAILSMGNDPGFALFPQTRHLRVRTRCACGCGSADFTVDAGAVAPVLAITGTRVVAEMELFGADGQTVGEVLVFVTDGYLSRLEVCSWSDELRTLPDAHRILCPCDR
ncbi:hypothetical protein [Streptomyces griseofuscus]|uniref:Uncharacterized protein n=1 Tax=Streptomyces griseofuscus TaxID=146922 RepID=A0A3R8RVF8_9ACTN|nr:hypothetical protein [Streptomyces griseofuscus]RRQ79134.1 hypothetical protein CQW44_34725 [Streptomyces griseofuscus]